MARTSAQLLDAINAALADPAAEGQARRAFVEREITFTDGSAGRRTAEHLMALITGKDGPDAGGRMRGAWIPGPGLIRC